MRVSELGKKKKMILLAAMGNIFLSSVGFVVAAAAAVVVVVVVVEDKRILIISRLFFEIHPGIKRVITTADGVKSLQRSIHLSIHPSIHDGPRCQPTLEESLGDVTFSSFSADLLLLEWNRWPAMTSPLEINSMTSRQLAAATSLADRAVN